MLTFVLSKDDKGVISLGEPTISGQHFYLINKTTYLPYYTIQKKLKIKHRGKKQTQIRTGIEVWYVVEATLYLIHLSDEHHSMVGMHKDSLMLTNFSKTMSMTIERLFS